MTKMERAGIIIRSVEFNLKFSSSNGNWMLHCQCEAERCQRISSWDIIVILIDLLFFQVFASCQRVLDGELLPFPVASQIQRLGRW